MELLTRDYDKDHMSQDRWSLDYIKSMFEYPTIQLNKNDGIVDSVNTIIKQLLYSDSIDYLWNRETINRRIGRAVSFKEFFDLILINNTEHGFFTTGIKSHVKLFKYIGEVTNLWTVKIFDKLDKYEDSLNKVPKITQTEKPTIEYGCETNWYDQYNCYRHTYKLYCSRRKKLEITYYSSNSICCICQNNTCPDKISDRDKNRKIHFNAKIITSKQRSIKAALTIILILKFRRNEFIFPGFLDKNIILMIALYVYNTKDDDIWNKGNNKIIK